VTGRALVGVVAIVLAGCASTPESRLRDEVWNDIYWTTARTCRGEFTNFAVDKIGADGSLALKGHISTGIADFRKCYWDRVADKIERRRSDGQPVPEWVNPHPEVDVDTD